MPRKKLKIDILFEDDRFLVANKPSGLLSIPDRYDITAPTIITLLDRPGAKPVHRLDRETSGTIAIALTDEAHRVLNDQFAERVVKKVYHALVQGEPLAENFTVDSPIAVSQGRNHRSVISADGKEAVTEFSLVKRLGPYSLLEARPLTGRTHQIRVHLESQRLPIVADTLYGNGNQLFLSSVKRSYTPGRREERPLMGRLALHAFQLGFSDPASGEALTFEAPHPKDFRATLNQLSKLFA